MKNRIHTLSIRVIKKTYKRFLSLAILSFLGVGVFVGINMSSPDMMASLDTYYDQNNMYDIKIISTLGLTEDDVTKIKNLNQDFDVYGLHSKDIELQTQDKSAVIRLMEINENINKIRVTEGRMPQNSSEILVEEGAIKKGKLKIGDTINTGLPDDDNTLNVKDFKIVGVVSSPVYILNGNGNLNRGTTTLGYGSVTFYAYVLKETFKMDYYTEIDLTVKNDYITETDEYKKLIKNAKEQIEQIQEEREIARKQELLNDANKKIDQEESGYLEQFKDAKNKLNDAEEQLKSGEHLLSISEKELKLAKQQLDEKEEELQNAYKKLEEGEKELENFKAKIDAGIEEINNNVSKYGLVYEDILVIKDVIEDRIITQDEFKAILPKNLKYYNEIIQIVNYVYENNHYEEFKQFIDNIDKEPLIQIIPKSIKNYNEVVEYLRTFNTEKLKNDIIDYFLDRNNIEKIKQKIPTYILGYDRIIKALTNYQIKLDNATKLFNGVTEIKNGLNKYNEGLILLQENKKKLDDGKNELFKYKKEYENGLNEFNKGKKEYNNGLDLYNTNLAEYNAKLNEFEENIKKARENANTIPKANWFINERKDTNDYNTFIDSSNSVNNLSIIFPTIFFVVAIFISLISMSRMAIEDRGEIGTLKSLGFSNVDIRKKYIIYSLFATLFGGILGEAFGLILLPRVIFNTYRIMFDVPVFTLSNEIMPAIKGLTISIICICGATIITINGLIKEKTTELLRPKAPLKGKKILLEKIKFIWKRLKFSNKITIRNIFRYKKRVAMTTLGIMGCTVLLITGYAIKDSIVNIAQKHFSEIFLYDDFIVMDGQQTKEELDNIFSKNYIDKRVDAKFNTIKFDTKTAFLVVPEDVNKVDDLIKLTDKETNQKVNLERGKVVVTSKLAKALKVKENDTLEFTDTENKKHSFIISGIVKNYVGHYVYMDKETYEERINKYSIDCVYIKLNDTITEELALKDILKNKHVLTFSSAKEQTQRVSQMFKSLDNIVLILVVLSGALSFVVLYNLSYINISERQREIATLKVLGFNHKEIDSYIIKEEVLITLLGIFLGLFTGTWFSIKIIETVELEMVEFIKQITPFSYCITVVFMIVFALIVNIKVHYKLKKIDMIESLKSIE